ncbi:MAG: A24 family peptidase [Candidatus Babeliaceae bacterium]|nr:A24 family peptidase [Candidatus Babeliaceae bacterium]
MIQHLLWIVFVAALLVTFLTDYYYLLIYRAATIFLIPIFFCGAFLCATPSTITESFLGVFVGYAFLWMFKYFYLWYKNIDGIGQGDLELLAMIGSFMGPMGVLYTITFGSILGTCIALLMLFTKHAHTHTQLPFGSFLVIGCLLYIFLQ